MKKILLGMLLIGSVATVSAQTGQADSTKTAKKTTHVHKHTTSTSSNDGANMGQSTHKKHHGWTKGKHRGRGVAVKKTTTTTTTTSSSTQ